MSGLKYRVALLSACFLAVAGLSGCATPGAHVDGSADLTQAASAGTSPVVFGKFRLIRNGEEADFGTSIFDSLATLHLSRAGSNGEIVGRVGESGEFAMTLEPGLYRVTSISFSNRGQRVKPLTSFTFEVAATDEAIYIGTMTMETTFDSGYYGLNGVVDGYTVRNDCATDCADRLSRLGLSDTQATIQLMQQQGQFASVR